MPRRPRIYYTDTQKASLHRASKLTRLWLILVKVKILEFGRVERFDQTEADCATCLGAWRRRRNTFLVHYLYFLSSKDCCGHCGVSVEIELGFGRRVVGDEYAATIVLR